MSLPSSLAFAPKRSAVNSRIVTQMNIPSQGTNISPNDTVQVPITATGKYGTFLDPSSIYVSFTLQNTDAANDLILDSSAYSLFDRVQILSSGSVISDVQFYGAWAATMLDLGPQASRTTGLSCCAGTATAPSNTSNNVRLGQKIPFGKSLNISLPLIGTAIDASASDKMFPIGAVSDLQLQFYMSSAKNSGIWPKQTDGSLGTSGSWKISNFRVSTSYVQVDEAAMRMIEEEHQGVYKYSIEAWRNYAFTQPAGNTADTIPIPIKVASLKSILNTWRYTAGNESFGVHWNSVRLCPFSNITSTNTSSYYIAIGSDCFPQVPLRHVGEHYQSLMNTWHAASVQGAYDNSLIAGEYDAWTAPSGTATITGGAGSFVSGVNLEAYNSRSNVSASGVSVLGGTTALLTAQYESNLAPNAGYVINSFCHVDAILEIANGGMIVAY